MVARKQEFYGRGKILLSGEYFVLDGAMALALPTSVGQRMVVHYDYSSDPVLHWQSYDCEQKVWFEAIYELWRFDLIKSSDSNNALFLQKILKQARLQNSHFLRDEEDVRVATYLEFPLQWGLGSSATLVHNIAQWAYVGAFELLFNTLGGSGYDLACAGGRQAIFYEKHREGPRWSPFDYRPAFADQLFFLYLGQKQSSAQGIEHYQKFRPIAPSILRAISQLSQELAAINQLPLFEALLREHESIVATTLQLPRAKERFFSDYWGEIKSLGAWGGDFVLVTSSESIEQTRNYFSSRGFSTLLPFAELIAAHEPTHTL